MEEVKSKFVPSGHAAIGFAANTLIWLLTDNIVILMLSLVTAILLAESRIAAKEHKLSIGRFGAKQFLELLDYMDKMLLGNEDAQNAVVESGVDVLLGDLVAHIEGTAHGTNETFPAQIPGRALLRVIGAADGGADVQVAVLQLRVHIFLLNAGQINRHLEALLGLADVRIHKARGIVVAESGVGNLVKQISRKGVGGIHKNCSFQHLGSCPR